jgi:alcohol dehydrogenase (cytochrome c)
MNRRFLIIAGIVVVIGAVIAGVVVYKNLVNAELVAARGMNDLKAFYAPAGTLVTEVNPDAKDAVIPATAGPPAGTTGADWPSYNQTLTSERFSGAKQIDTTNVGQLKVLCTYDTKLLTSFESGLIMVNGALIGTTEHDTFSLDPSNCHENWRVHEDSAPALLSANRGVAFMDGRLFRGTTDGRVLAYDFATGKKLWQTTVSSAQRMESIPAAPIAWNGMVFIGNAGGDYKGGRGHMFALDGATGKILWEFYLVPKVAGDPPRGPEGASPLDTSTWPNGPNTPISGGGAWTSYTLDPAKGLIYIPVGNPAPDFAIGPRDGENLYTGSILVLDAKTGAFKTYFKLVPRDWHDWDASNTPTLITTAAGRQVMAVAPKDGHLYGYDLATNKLLYRVPVTKIENVDQTFEQGKPVHFCPGGGGGAEWNGAAYNPLTNLITIGEVQWCDTVTLQGDKEIEAVRDATPWTGNSTLNPANLFGRFSKADGNWAGWVHAIDADTGVWKWRVQTNYPITSGMTPTAGGLVFFGDMGGNFYALNAANGQKLWGKKIGGAIGGGVITYMANGGQRVAVAVGVTSPAWPTEQSTAKVIILGL